MLPVFEQSHECGTNSKKIIQYSKNFRTSLIQKMINIIMSHCQRMHIGNIEENVHKISSILAMCERRDRRL